MSNIDFEIEGSTLKKYNGTDAHVVLPYEITEIEREAFRCKSIISIKMPNVLTIGSGAFKYCKSLISVDMPCVESIGQDAFSYCDSMQEAEMPALKRISRDAFAGCESLTRVSMPEVSCISGNPFSECTNLLDIIISPENEFYTVKNGAIFDAGEGVLICYPAARWDVVLPDSVYEIKQAALFGCRELTSVTMPNVRSIGVDAFTECEKLTKFVIPPENKYFASNNGMLFNGIKTELIAYPSAIGDIVVPDSVKHIGDCAFCHNSSIVKISMPNVETIGYRAFFKCAYLVEADMPNVIKINEEAFATAGNLVRSNMPQVKIIMYNAFNLCGFKKLEMPNVMLIDDGAFSECYSLETMEMPSVAKIGESAFYDCCNLNKVVMPDDVSIDKYAFLETKIKDYD